MPTPPNRRPAQLSAADYRAQLSSGRDASTSPTPKARKKSSAANQLTQAVLSLLHLRGFAAWRQNNAAVYDASFGGYRAGSATPGIADVLGYCRRTGRFCAVEVKAGSDKLSPAQVAFLAGIRDAGGFACCARSIAQVEQELSRYLASAGGSP